MDLSVKFFNFLSNIKNAFDLSSPFRVVMLILDVAIVAVVVYYIYVLIKKTRAVQIFKGFLIILALLAVSELLDLVILNFILENFLTYGMILMIIVFQPELRSALEKLGRKNFTNIFDFDDKIRDKQVIYIYTGGGDAEGTLADMQSSVQGLNKYLKLDVVKEYSYKALNLDDVKNQKDKINEMIEEIEQII